MLGTEPGSCDFKYDSNYIFKIQFYLCVCVCVCVWGGGGRGVGGGPEKGFGPNGNKEN